MDQTFGRWWRGWDGRREWRGAKERRIRNRVAVNGQTGSNTYIRRTECIDLLQFYCVFIKMYPDRSIRHSNESHVVARAFDSLL